MLKYTILTHDPSYYPGPLLKGILRRAYNRLYTLAINPLPSPNILYAKPYGHTSGLCMRIDYLDTILKPYQDRGAKIYLTSPSGRILDSAYIQEIIANDDVVFIVPRYTGADSRILSHYACETISIGNYILTNGDLAAVVILESLVRILELKESKPAALEFDAIEKGLDLYPIYTKPRIFQNLEVPGVLLNGASKLAHHFNSRQSLLNMSIGKIGQFLDYLIKAKFIT
jgi:tRNA (guanine37-N1)-methyltransferase